MQPKLHTSLDSVCICVYVCVSVNTHVWVNVCNLVITEAWGASVDEFQNAGRSKFVKGRTYVSEFRSISLYPDTLYQI